MSKTTLDISYLDDQQELLTEALRDLDPADLAQVEVIWKPGPTEGLAGEPVTVGAIITGGTMVILAVIRLIERKMENDRQLKAMEMVAKAYEKDPTLAKELAGLSAKHAEVSTSYALLSLPKGAGEGG